MNASKRVNTATVEADPTRKFRFSVMVEDDVTGLMRPTMHGGCATEDKLWLEANRWSTHHNGAYVQLWCGRENRVVWSAGVIQKD